MQIEALNTGLTDEQVLQAFTKALASASTEDLAAVQAALMTAIGDAITDATAMYDERYLRIGTGTAVENGTDFNTLKTRGKFRNGNANNGCRNMPQEVAGRPFTVVVENMYGASRYKQTLWLGQSGYVDRFYWRIMTNDTTWSDWYKVTGTVVTTDVPSAVA